MKKRIMVLGMSPRVGGVESYIMNWIRIIDKSKYEFFFPYYSEIAYYDELLSLGANFIKLEVSRHTPVRYYKYLKKLFEKYKFDVVYYNTCDIMSMDMIMMGKKCNVPIRIIHSHNSANIVNPNLLHKYTERWCRKHLDEYATKLLACSDIAGKWMFDGREFEVINNGIDTKKFRFSPSMRGKKRDELGLKDEFAVGFVGSLWNQKNPLFLIKVFNEVCKKTKNAILLVIGDGELREEMKEEVINLGISGKVKFLGVRSDINDLLNAMDCFLLPSKFEGLPFVLVEAQTNGLPCITSKNVSEESNITGEVNYISLDESIDKWGDIIVEAQVKYGREKYESIMKKENFDINKTVERLEELFTSVHE